jgi:hypothetical protein
MKRRTENGSALVYVFIGIALFGVLMFVFSRGSSQNTSSITNQQATLASTEIIEYGRKIDMAFANLLSKGCSESDISFFHPNFTGANDYFGGANFSNPALNQCHIFAPTGGRARFQKPPKPLSQDFGISDYAFSGILGVYNLGGNNCPDTELTMVIEVTQEICKQYNKINGINAGTGIIPNEEGGEAFENTPGWYTDGSRRTPKNFYKLGMYGCGTHIGHPSNTPRATELIGKTNGCYRTTQGADGYYAYHVINPR